MAPAKQEPDIVVQIARNFDGPDVNIPRLKKLVKTVCTRFKACERRETIVSVAIVDNAEMKRVNKQFLRHNATTDCLSFNLSDDQSRAAKRKDSQTQKNLVLGPNGKRLHSSSQSSKLFELVVNGEMAVKEANLRGHCGEAELALYITHGLLHNLGFDDATQAEAKKMHETEDEILQELGYGLVYNKGTRA